MASRTGQVRQLDFIQSLNLCQVILDDFVGIVRNARLLAVLEAALGTDFATTVYFEDGDPPRITRATIRRDAPGDPIGADLWYIIEIDINEDDGLGSMTLIGSDGEEVTRITRDDRLESLLILALCDEWKVADVEIDEHTTEIIRAKLEMSTP